ncbi:MAG: hypothetical protein K0S00_4087 [Xanthobacteraceae bacterium]|jgi:hypothetical protein|nr:hypothetical protein [Xanthobacteraceae bacterium]
MRRAWGVIIFFLISLGCFVAHAHAAKKEAALPYGLSAAEIAAVESGVREDLKDPDSAKFSGFVATKEPSSGMVTVCGYVNARNSFGGYAGKKLFYGLLAVPQINFIPIGLGGNEAVHASMCRDAGIKF